MPKVLETVLDQTTHLVEPRTVKAHDSNSLKKQISNRITLN